MSHPAEPAALLLAPEAVVLHIGPHKTGTTAIQEALAARRSELRDLGVLYPGVKTSQTRAAWDLVGYQNRVGLPRARPYDWQDVVDETRAWTTGRTVISSEFFDMADDAAAARAIGELGDDTHVVVTLRAFARILPSSWQQSVAAGMEADYDTWLHDLFEDPAARRTTTAFWQRHRYDELIERWMTASDGRLTVLIPEVGDREMIPRSFEQMLGLPSGMLDAVPGRANRSLSHAEAEVVRGLRPRFRDRRWPLADYGRMVNKGLVPALKGSRSPEPDEPRIVTPPWALDRAVELGAQMAASIESGGARVIGDIATLGARPAPVPDHGVPGAVEVGLAADVVMASLESWADERQRILRPPPLSSVSGRDLAKELWARILRRVRRIRPGRGREVSRSAP